MGNQVCASAGACCTSDASTEQNMYDLSQATKVQN